MYCQHCGHQNPDGATVCEACGQAPTPFASSNASPPPVPPPPPSHAIGLAPDTVPNYLVWSILATLCCCVPGGIVAIVYSSQVNSKLALGDLAGAIEASNKAKTWCLVSAGVGLVVGVLYGILNVFVAAGQGY